MTEFIINRDNWMTPDHPNWDGTNALLNRDGTMCCLGFYCNRVARVEKNKLQGLSFPSELDMAKPTLEKIAEVEEDFVSENDDERIDAKTREERISKLFKELGYKVKFVGKRQVRRKEEDFDEE